MVGTTDPIAEPFDFEVGGLVTEAGNNTILMSDGNNVINADLDEDDEVDKSQEEPTVMYNDDLSIHELEVAVSPLDSDEPSLILPDSEDTSEASTGSILTDPNTAPPFDLAGVCDLATIEEQPELGYSSESEGVGNFEPNFHGKISRESNTSITTPQLDPLLELSEETNNKPLNDNTEKDNSKN